MSAPESTAGDTLMSPATHSSDAVTEASTIRHNGPPPPPPPPPVQVSRPYRRILPFYKRKRHPSLLLDSVSSRSKKQVHFALAPSEADPQILPTNLRHLSLQDATVRAHNSEATPPPDVIEHEAWAITHKNDTLRPTEIPDDFKFTGPAGRTWDTIRDHTATAAKSEVRATLVHNVRHYDSTPIWTTGARRLPHFLLPFSGQESFCQLIRKQSAERLALLEELLRSEAEDSRIVAEHTATVMNPLLTTDIERTAFPLLLDHTRKFMTHKVTNSSKTLLEQFRQIPTDAELLNVLVEEDPATPSYRRQGRPARDGRRRSRSRSPAARRKPQPTHNNGDKSRRHPGNRDVNNTQDRPRSRPQESTSRPTGSSNFTARDVAQFKEFQAFMAQNRGNGQQNNSKHGYYKRT